MPEPLPDHILEIDETLALAANATLTGELRDAEGYY